MSGVLFEETVTGHTGGVARPLPVAVIQTQPLVTLIGILGWLLAGLVLTPLPGAGPALLVSSLGALIVLVAAPPFRRHILR